MLFDTPAWQLLSQSDVMTWIILIFLFILSVVCVAVAIAKILDLSERKRNLNKFLFQLGTVKNLQGLVELGKTHSHSMGGRLVSYMMADLETHGGSATEVVCDRIAASSDHEVDQLIAQSWSYVPVLGTCAAVSPLIGLFGTVWGLIHAFVGISQQKTADIAVVAPGIAEALLTTLAGLIVAIPALMFYNYLSHQLREVERKMFLIQERILSIIQSNCSKGS